jgi:hypothetical protein
MQSFSIKRVLLETAAIIVIAATISAILVPLLNQRSVADEPGAAPTAAPQQPSLDEIFRDFADRMALDQRLRTLEQQMQTLLNTGPTTAPQQPPSAVLPQNFADRKVLDERIRTLERQIQTLSNATPTTTPQQLPSAVPSRDFANRRAVDQQQTQTLTSTAPTTVPQLPRIVVPSQDSADRKALDWQQIQTLSNTDERPVQTLSDKFPTSSVTLKPATTKYRHRRPHEIEGTAVARGTGYANPGGRPGITKASGPYTAPKATREYDEAGNEIK